MHIGWEPTRLAPGRIIHDNDLFPHRFIAPEERFTEYKLLENRSDTANIILNRVLVIVIVFLLVAVV